MDNDGVNNLDSFSNLEEDNNGDVDQHNDDTQSLSSASAENFHTKQIATPKDGDRHQAGKISTNLSNFNAYPKSGTVNSDISFN